MRQESIPFVNLGIQFERFQNEIIEKFKQISSAGHYILGAEVEAFEHEFAEYCQAKFALGVANGADALFLVMKALGVGAGDEVITAPNSFLASAGAIVATGARATFCDVAEDYNLDPEKLAAAITPKTKGVMPVHLTGLPADMGPILEVANKHGLFVLEDCAQAVGARYKGKRIGAIGTAGAFSLHPLKNLHVHGDGGAITTNDEKLYQKLKLLRNHGLKNRDECEIWGYNSRLDAIQAAIARIKLRHLDEMTTRYQTIADNYWRGLKGVVRVPDRPDFAEGVYHNFVIQVERRPQLQEYLSSKGIETKIHYPIPIHLQQPARKWGHQEGDFPVAERQVTKILSLPIYPELTDEQVSRVISEIRFFYEAT